MTLQEKTKRLLEVSARVKILKAQFDEQISPFKTEEEELRSDILSSMKRNGLYTARFDEATATIAVRKSLAIIDPEALVKDLKKKGMNDYVSESINDLFKETLAKDIAKSGTTELAGTEIRETEYLTVKEPSAKEDKRKLEE
jgi:hypothetical protein